MDDDALDAAQMTELRQDLDDLAAAIRAQLEGGGARAATVQLDQSAVGRVSRIDAIQQQQMAQAERRRLRVRLQQIDRALVAMEDDDYGWCTRCGEAIGFRRLKIRPESALCVACLAALER